MSLPYQQQDLKVLLLADNTADQQLVSEICDQCGYPTTLTCIDHIEELNAQLQESPLAYSLALLQLDLTDPAAIELLRHLVDQPESKKLVIIAIALAASPDHIGLCYELGLNSCMRRPTDTLLYKQRLSTIVDYWTNLSTHPRVGA